MTDTSMPTDLLVSACRRLASREGVLMLERQKGDPKSGVILIKINYLNGKAQILSQLRLDDKLVWTPRKENGFLDDEEAEAILKREQSFDPDLWIIEIEDPKGRHFFPGEIISL